MHSMGVYPPPPQQNIQYNYTPLMDYSAGPSNNASNYYPQIMHEHSDAYQPVGHDLSHTNFELSHQDYPQPNWNM